MADSKVVADVRVEPGYIDALLELMEQIALEIKIKKGVTLAASGNEQKCGSVDAAGRGEGEEVFF